ncbi:MAG: DUF4160 domain-containing protein [Coriobacteriales bacterium]|jgi:hypothetical protein|nr:DUF4160 domain-containing protein [Coriobacteriales bacterium]
MPVIARLDNGNLIIKFYFKDHNPPHVHAMRGEADGEFDIGTGKMMVGDLTSSDQKTIGEWITSHSQSLLRVWETNDTGELDA